VAEQHLEAAGQIARDAAKAVIGDGDRLNPYLKRRSSAEAGRGLKPLYAHGFLLVDSIRREEKIMPFSM
jgi:hypothetical protein